MIGGAIMYEVTVDIKGPARTGKTILANFISNINGNLKCHLLDCQFTVTENNKFIRRTFNPGHVGSDPGKYRYCTHFKINIETTK